ncbi:unnamed protein product [Mucor hiemalis]
MFALLAMLKTVADKYHFASVGEFENLKLYFVQPSDKFIRLWSMQYAKHGLYNFVREKKILVSEDFEQRGDHLESLIDTSPCRDWVICVPTAFLGGSSRYSGSLSGIEPRYPL